jgi:hypothetical protein
VKTNEEVKLAEVGARLSGGFAVEGRAERAGPAAAAMSWKAQGPGLGGSCAAEAGLWRAGACGLRAGQLRVLRGGVALARVERGKETAARMGRRSGRAGRGLCGVAGLASRSRGGFGVCWKRGGVRWLGGRREELARLGGLLLGLLCWRCGVHRARKELAAGRAWQCERELGGGLG